MEVTKRNNTEYLDFVESKFDECFSEKNYYKESPVDITSKIDLTVDFVGSSISPLKKYIINNNIPEQGIYLNQNSMKSKSLKYLKSDVPQKFGCYYKCMGILTKPNLEKVVYDTFDYFINYLNIPVDDICIRICSQDSDLVKAIKNVDLGIKREYDTVDLKHYRHKYGMESRNITGRDFNIGIRKKGTNNFFNCGAFVLMESPDGPIAIDMAIGNCSLSLCKFGYNSTIASSRMGDLIEINSLEQEKFADALIAVSILLKENILEQSSKHFKYKFKRYLNILLYWNQKYNFMEEKLVDIILKFLELEYNSNFEEKRESWTKVLKKEK